MKPDLRFLILRAICSFLSSAWRILFLFLITVTKSVPPVLLKFYLRLQTWLSSSSSNRGTLIFSTCQRERKLEKPMDREKEKKSREKRELELSTRSFFSSFSSSSSSSSATITTSFFLSIHSRQARERCQWQEVDNDDDDNDDDIINHVRKDEGK